ncbi:ABC transporter permease [Neorhizobium sp. LMR1-1-1.1]
MTVLSTHLRVVFAFVVREIATRYGKSPGGYLWAFLEPIAFIAVMSVILGSIGRIPALGESFPLFYATGFLAYSLYKSVESYVSSSISANRSLLSYPRVAPIDAVVSRFVLQGTTSILVASLILGVILYTLRHPIHIDWIYIFAAVFLAWSLGVGVGMTNCVLFFYYPLYEKAYGVIMKPLFLLSGVFYVPESIPHPYRDYILYNPLAHIIMLFRWAFYGDRGARGVDLMYVATISFTMLFIGMLMFTLFPISRQRS